MESTTWKAVITIALSCSFFGCSPADSPERIAKRNLPAVAPAKPAEPFQSSISPPTRKDNALSEKVKTALTTTTEIKAGGLQVSAADGVVTLDGTVEADREKQRAALIAMDVEGVRSVVNNLVVLKSSG